jgi:hypothetical protein
VFQRIQHLFQHMLRNLFSFFYLEMLNQVQHDGLRGNTQFNEVSHPASVSVYVTESFWAVIPTTEESRFSLTSCREKMSPLST